MLIADQEDRDWQRLDKWLWCARFLRSRSACADLVMQGSIRVNRQPTAKPHARLRPGDVLTLPVQGTVRVVRVKALALRRGAAAEARLLYADITDLSVTSCVEAESSAYRGV
jgi:ribosome-associated heat shock protein Hsp15